MSETSITALRQAIEHAGSAAALARHIGVTPQAIYQWDRVPAERVIAIEAATGGAVSRCDLRPDLYPREPAKIPPASNDATPRAAVAGE